MLILIPRPWKNETRMIASSGMTMPPNQTTLKPESDHTPAGRRGSRRRTKSSLAVSAAAIAA